MTEKDIAEIRARLDAADGWPWHYEKRGQMVFGNSAGGCNKTESDYRVADIRGWGHLQYMGETRGDAFAEALQDANGELVAHAPEDISKLLAHVTEQSAKFARMEEALKANDVMVKNILNCGDNCAVCTFEVGTLSEMNNAILGKPEYRK